MVLDDHVYADYAQSGAFLERPELRRLLDAAGQRLFDVVFVDDLSRLARDNTYMLSMLADFRYEGIRLISVTDHLDTADEESTFFIQMRGAVNELMLSDLRKKTHRGQLGQKQRGFFVGESTYGFRSYPHGNVRIDKRGRTRPEGYKMRIEPDEAAVIRRIYDDFAGGFAINRLVAQLNEEGVLHPKAGGSGWGPATLDRILSNPKYIGRWTWNRTGTRRDRAGRRRTYVKPESEHFVLVDESLRIIPQSLWDAVQARRKEVKKVWPGGKRRGFSSGQRSRSEVYPNHLFDGMLRCACCKQAIAVVGGKSGGYYGCLGARRSVCDNRLTIRRSKLERIFLCALRDRLLDPVIIRYALQRVADEVATLHGDVADVRGRKQTELVQARTELNRFVDFIRRGQVSDSAVLAAELVVVERRVSRLQVEVDALRDGDGSVISVPSEEWIAARVAELQVLLERRTPKSAVVLRRLFGQVYLEPVRPERGRAHLRCAHHARHARPCRSVRALQGSGRWFRIFPMVEVPGV